MVPEAGLEPAHAHHIMDFESIASTIPPFGRASLKESPKIIRNAVAKINRKICKGAISLFARRLG